MLIVSKFHDYYDTAIAYGVDKDTVYKRETIDHSLNLPLVGGHDLYSVYGKDYVVIGFAGDLYPMVRIRDTQWPFENTYYFYTYKDLKEYLDKEKKKISYYSGWGRNSLKTFFDKNRWNFLNKYFREYHCPTFIYRKDSSGNYIITTNPILKDYAFYRIKDSFTAFQEIHMFLAGVLGNIEKDITPIDDKHMLKQKGFYEYSFKKLPTKKKK